MSTKQLEQIVLSLSPGVKAEILRRREEALAHPEKLEAWETAFPRMKQRFTELRRSARRRNIG